MTARDAAAVGSLSTEELAAHCAHYQTEPVGEDAAFCIRYIQGFIDGAVATDARVTRNVAAEYAQYSEFTERAIRTRLGRRIEQCGPSYYAEFCLGAPVPLKEVVDRVVRNVLDGGFVAGEPLASEVVYQTLRTEYPCQRDEN
jgi:hypothetical protein